MSDEDTLRRAAAKVREAGAKASKNVCPSWTYSAVRHISRNCEIDCAHVDRFSDDPEKFEPPDDGVDHDGWQRYQDAPWISVADARIAEPLAAWLDHAAERMSVYDEEYPPDGNSGWFALNLARALLGEQVPA